MISDIKAVRGEAVCVVNVPIEDFQHCFDQGKIRLERYRERRGLYIEEDNKGICENSK